MQCNLNVMYAELVTNQYGALREMLKEITHSPVAQPIGDDDEDAKKILEYIDLLQQQMRILEPYINKKSLSDEELLTLNEQLGPVSEKVQILNAYLQRTNDNAFAYLTQTLDKELKEQGTVWDDIIDVLESAAGLTLTETQVKELLNADIGTLVSDATSYGADDTEVRGRLLDHLSRTLVGRNWPMYKEEADMDAFAEAMNAAALKRGYRIYGE